MAIPQKIRGKLGGETSARGGDFPPFPPPSVSIPDQSDRLSMTDCYFVLYIMNTNSPSALESAPSKGAPSRAGILGPAKIQSKHKQDSSVAAANLLLNAEIQYRD